ncbi:hypothetical protein V8D89_008259 [Ganoderma adspersum]
MSLVHYLQPEAPQNVGHPSMQSELKKAASLHGPTKRKPTGDFVAIDQGNGMRSSPTKRSCTSPSIQQGWLVPAASCTPESEVTVSHSFIELLLQNRTAGLVQTQSRSNVENIPSAHAGSTRVPSFPPGAISGEPGDAWHNDADGSPQVERSSAEKARIVKGKQPDRRPRKDKRSHKPEASRDVIAQNFLSFLAQNLHTTQQTGPGAEAQIAAAAREPQPCVGSHLNPPARYPCEVPVMYESPFEGMLVQRTPWPAAAAVVQEMGCSCSVCVRALVKGLENAAPCTAMPSLPHSQPRMEDIPALEPMSGGVVAPPGSNEARAEIIQPASFPSHQFFPHIEEAPYASGERFSGACNVC